MQCLQVELKNEVQLFVGAFDNISLIRMGHVKKYLEIGDEWPNHNMGILCGDHIKSWYPIAWLHGRKGRIFVTRMFGTCVRR